MKPLPYLLLLLLAWPAWAQDNRYISDQLEVPMRAGTSTKFKILRMLKSGSRISILNKNKENGYRLIRTESGVKGWVLDRYLMPDPSARDSLAQAQQAVLPLQNENKQLKQQLQTLQQEKVALASDLDKTQKDNQNLSQDLSQIRRTSANAIAIDERNQALEQQMIDLERSLQIVQQENQALRENSNQAWFIRGAGVLVLGLLLGLIVPRLRVRKSSRWGDL